MLENPRVLNLIAIAGVVFCWMVFAGVFVLRRKPASPPDSKRDPKSIRGLVLQGVGFALVWSIRRGLATEFVPGLPSAARLALALLAVLVAASSTSLMIAAVRSLGKEWSLTARLVEGHRLVTNGPYNIVRNPIYTGMLGMLVATGLVLSHWIALIAAIVVFMIGTMIRVKREEKLLRSQFGSEFEAYTRRVRAIIPLLY